MREGNASELGRNLGRRLAILRESRNLSKAELARKAKISSSSLSLYESGTKIPELATLFRILEALDYGFGALDRADEPASRCGSPPDAGRRSGSPIRCGPRS